MLLPIHIYFYPYLVSIKSEYVIIIGNALLSFVWRVSPSEMEGSRPALWFSHVRSIAHISLSGNYNMLFWQQRRPAPISASSQVAVSPFLQYL
mgnify:CR=1 FL=1